MLLNFIFGSPKVASSNGNGDLSAKVLQREKSGLATVTGTIELIDDWNCYMHQQLLYQHTSEIVWKQTKSNHLKKGDYSNYWGYLLHNELNIAFWFSLQVFDLCREGYPCDQNLGFLSKDLDINIQSTDLFRFFTP